MWWLIALAGGMLSVALSDLASEEIRARLDRDALGLKEVGVLAEGKSADFIVLNANPLDDIRNTRQIADVYLHGAKLDRNALLAKWKKADGR